MSGGRATVQRRKGVIVRQSGDVCAVVPGGHTLTNEWYIEVKHYKRIDFGQWAISNQGKIKGWWARAKSEARQHGREPMLIVKQNAWPVLVITRLEKLEIWTPRQCQLDARGCDVSLFSDMVKAKYYDETRGMV